MKLHLACGKHVLDGWVNVDIARHPAAPREPDIMADVTSIPLDDAVADEIMAIHVFEHFYRWEVDGLLKEWGRLLKSGGRLVMEMPDIIKAARNLLDGKGDQMAMWPIYGDQTLENPFMCHRYGWTFKTIKPVLEQAGFRDVTLHFPEWHKRRNDRDFRVECVKC
jgi:predicted SAM-dependent methyltransferase